VIPSFVLMDFSRSCLFIDLTIFGTSCFNNHIGVHKMQNFSISFFINNINASQETKHHQQQSKSVDEKKLKLEKTKTMKGLDLKHKNAEYLIISCQSQKKKKKKN
jgi:hypothetical protein